MMDYKSYQNYQSSVRGLLNQALVEALKRNESQTKTWKDYKKAHEKVKKGLEILPQELTTSCMVPIGPKALMRGKIVHTNEILVCLGEGYFAKYSAKQAIAVCDRRIKQAHEMLINIEKEQNLLEMRQSLPVDYGIFGDEERQEIIEPYVEEEEKEWRIKHRQREKEYRLKLAQLRAQEKTQIQSEEDLWQRLDELELQEDLEDEIDRLHEDDCNYYGEDNQDNEVSYEEEDADFSEDETPNDMIEEQLKKMKDGNIPKHQKDLFEKENLDKETDSQSSSTHNISNPQLLGCSSTSIDTAILEMESSREIFDDVEPLSSTSFSMNKKLIQNEGLANESSETSMSTTDEGSTDVRYSDSVGSSSQNENEMEKLVPSKSEHQKPRQDGHKVSQSDSKKRRVSFTDKIQVNVFENTRHHSFDEPLKKQQESSSESDSEDDIEKRQIIEDMISAGVDFPSNDDPIEDSTENGDEEEDDVIRIEVKHSSRKPKAAKSIGDDLIEDPTDIYRIFCKPKSILKKTLSDLSQSQNITPPADDVFDQETEDPPFGSSYTIIVKDVEERKPEVLEVNVPAVNTRPPSRFKMARSGVKR